MFHCWLSGVCCHDLQVSPQELSEMIQAGPILRPLNVEQSGDGHTLAIMGTCPWLAADKTCSIYEHRPEVCRAYLCYRGKPTDPHRTPQEQYEFMKNNPDAQEQAKSMRKESMKRAKELRGWSWLELEDENTL